MTQINEKLLLSRFEDLERSTERGHKPCFSRFLDPREQRLFAQHYRPRCPYMLWGGYEDAERKMVGFFPDYLEPDGAEFPIVPLRLSSGEALGHRDILGALMSLGIERNLIGDIAKEEAGPVLFATESAKDFLMLECTRAGRTRIKLSEAEPESLAILPKEWKAISGTVASLRLDCVLGLLTGASRSAADEMLRREAVSVNHSVCTKGSVTLDEGDVLSVRGHGRAEVLEIGGETKKGRMRVTLKKYI